MSIQKTPDQPSGKNHVDDKAVQWEEDLRPFSRLPRDTASHERSQRVEQKSTVWVPALISLGVSLLLCSLLASYFNRNLPNVSAIAASFQPTETKPAPTATVDRPRPTATRYVAPTETPIPTKAPQTTAAAGEIGVGGYVRIIETGPDGLNFRTDPSRNAQKIRALPEGGVFEVVGGPNKSEGITWWQLKDKDGTIGWGSSAYMAAARKP